MWPTRQWRGRPVKRRLTLAPGETAYTACARVLLRGGVVEKSGESVSAAVLAERVGWCAELVSVMAAGLPAVHWNRVDVEVLAGGVDVGGRRLPSQAWMALRRLGPGGRCRGGGDLSGRSAFIGGPWDGPHPEHPVVAASARPDLGPHSAPGRRDRHRHGDRARPQHLQAMPAMSDSAAALQSAGQARGRRVEVGAHTPRAQATQGTLPRPAQRPGGSASGGTRTNGPEEAAPRSPPAPGRAGDQHTHQTTPSTRGSVRRGVPPPRTRHPTPVGSDPESCLR
ncbi:hypothetical protein H4W80_003097 [Nonomuraea angiospora]|uniref:Uncharacterized protein n=1 Tax=Nonomuraea angiospora TaxID=46172 RepID=A0ABR9LW12_9ACTN|nr:hypothetical protein [Nonomuraea angiospora]